MHILTYASNLAPREAGIEGCVLEDYHLEPFAWQENDWHAVCEYGDQQLRDHCQIRLERARVEFGTDFLAAGRLFESETPGKRELDTLQRHAPPGQACNHKRPPRSLPRNRDLLELVIDRTKQDLHDVAVWRTEATKLSF